MQGGFQKLEKGCTIPDGAADDMILQGLLDAGFEVIAPGITLSQGLGLSLQQPVWEGHQPPTRRGVRILPSEPSIDQVAKGVPQLHADRPGRMGIVGTEAALGCPRRPGHHDIHFQPPRMGVGGDQRREARLLRQACIGDLEEQPQGLRNGLPRNGIPRIEALDVDVLPVEGHRGDAVAMLPGQNIDCCPHQAWMSRQDFRGGVANDPDPLAVEILCHERVDKVADRRMRGAVGLRSAVGRPAEDHSTPPRRASTVSLRSIAIKRISRTDVLASSPSDTLRARASKAACMP